MKKKTYNMTQLRIFWRRLAVLHMELVVSLSQLRFHGNESVLPVYNFMKIIAIFSSSEFVCVQFNFSSSKKF